MQLQKVLEVERWHMEICRHVIRLDEQTKA